MLIIFYALYVAFGFGLMFLHIRFNNRKEYYYIAAVISFLVLSNISAVMGESYSYIFNPDNYNDVSIWLYIGVVIVMVLPSVYLGYPLIVLYKKILELGEDICLSIMNLFVRKETLESQDSIEDPEKLSLKSKSE